MSKKEPRYFVKEHQVLEREGGFILSPCTCRSIEMAEKIAAALNAVETMKAAPTKIHVRCRPQGRGVDDPLTAVLDINDILNELFEAIANLIALHSNPKKLAATQKIAECEKRALEAWEDHLGAQWLSDIAEPVTKGRKAARDAKAARLELQAAEKREGL